MSAQIIIRGVQQSDYDAWRPLWDGYNAFYGRYGPAALPEEITQATWGRFFDPCEPVNAMVAEESGHLIGLVHYLLPAGSFYRGACPRSRRRQAPHRGGVRGGA